MTDPKANPDLALLESALEEELGGATPPDLWNQLQARHKSEYTQPKIWSVAAIVLLAIGVLIAIATDQSRVAIPEPAGIVITDWPKTLAEARARLNGTVSNITVRADAVFDNDSGETVPFFVDQLAQMFASNELQIQDPGDRERLRRLLSQLQPQTTATPRSWEYTLTVTCENKPVTVRIAGCSQSSEVPERGMLELAIVGHDQLFALRPNIRFDNVLRTDLIELTKRMLRNGPLAIDGKGLRNLRDDIARLRCVRARADDATELRRFQNLQTLDLAESPELHTATSLAFLSPKLRSLSLDASRADIALLRAVGQLRQLEELFLKSPGDGVNQMLFGDIQARASNDAAIAGLERLTALRELSIPGTQITAIGLQSLAKLPKLTRLNMPNCDMLKDGFDAFRHAKLEHLNVIGCDELTPAALSEIALLPQLQHLSISPRPDLDLGLLKSSQSLRRLLVFGGLDTSMIAGLATLNQLNRLTLSATEDMPANELQMLRNALPNCEVRIRHDRETRSDPR